MTASQTKALREIGKWLAIIATALGAGSGGAWFATTATPQAQAVDLAPRVVTLEALVGDHTSTLRDMDGLLRQIDRNVSEIKGEMKARRNL